MHIEESAAPVRAVGESEVEIALEVLPCPGGRIERTSSRVVQGVPVVHEPVLDIRARGKRGCGGNGINRKLVGDDRFVRTNASHDRLAGSYRSIVLVGNGVVDVLREQRSAGEVRDDDIGSRRGVCVELVGNLGDGDVRLVWSRDERPRAGVLEEGVGHEIPEPGFAAAADGNEVANKLAVLPHLERV